MSLDLGGAVNAAADWACSAPLVRGVASNPVLTALLIVALVAVVVLALYRDPIKRAGLKRGVRALLYAFLLVLLVVFVHHSAIMRMARQATAQKGIREVFSGIEQSRTLGGPGVTVMPFLGQGVAAREPTEGGSPADRQPGAPTSRQPSVALGDGLTITDVVVPSAVGPPGGRGGPGPSVYF